MRADQSHRLVFKPRLASTPCVGPRAIYGTATESVVSTFFVAS
jgi:hypothetical protein